MSPSSNFCGILRRSTSKVHFCETKKIDGVIEDNKPTFTFIVTCQEIRCYQSINEDEETGEKEIVEGSLDSLQQTNYVFT